MATQSTLSLSLTPACLRILRQRVRSGRNQSASEVVCEGLRLLDKIDSGRDTFWEEVRGKVSQAREQLGRGRVVDGESAMAEILDTVPPVAARKTGGRRR